MEIINKNKLISFFKKQPIITAYLFGSQAKGNVTKLSDYDFAVQVDEDFPKEDYFDLRLKLINEITDVLNTDKIDVVIINDEATPLSLQFRIIKDGIILYCRDNIKRSDLEVKIMSEYFDRQYYLDRHIKYSLKKFAKEGLGL